MTPDAVGVGLGLLGLGLLVWPVAGVQERRIARLRRATRLAAAGAPARGSVVDRGRPLSVGVVLAGAVGATLGAGPAVGVAAGAALTAVAVLVAATRADRRRARVRRDLLTALAVLGGELDAGTAFPDALRTARARAGSAAAVFDLGPGRPAEPGSDPGPEPARPDPLAAARRGLRAGAALVSATGASWSAVVAGTARDLAARDARDREVASALAGARASTVLLAVLPLLGIGLAAALGADPVGFLVATPSGSLVLAAGAVLDLVGVVVATAVAGRAAR